MSDLTIRIAAPTEARAGEVMEVKALIRHAMESGYRRNAMGEAIPRDILKRFECLYNGERVFGAEFFPGVAANPILTFYVRAERSGELVFRWVDQHGAEFAEQRSLVVT